MSNRNGDGKALRLALFMTRGLSLRRWDEIGILDREVAVYRRLREHGVEVSIVTFGDRGELAYRERCPGIEILCNRWRLPDGLYERWLRRLHGRALRRCDVIKTNQSNGADVALRVARGLGKPLVARCGYMWSFVQSQRRGAGSPHARRALAVEQEVFSAADRVVVTTREMADDVAQRIPEARGRIAVVPNFVDTEVFSPDPAVTHDIDVISVGRLVEEKNVLALVDAVAPLPLRVVVVGDGPLRPRLVESAAGGAARFEWHRSVPNQELPGLLRRARVFVLPSLYEGHPKALLEAMACGVAVIGADSPGVATLIRDGASGYLCAPDAESIRRSIQRVLADGEGRRRVGEAARREALASFSLDLVFEQELAVLRAAAR